MPKINMMQNEADFMASVNQSLQKVHNKAIQNRRSFEDQSNPGYWKEQQTRKNNPRIKSYDALADYVLV